ncbi:MAG: hypothetical protein IJ024_06160 [Lachnospiraceae bacterium]|nr:hypothetical protein [Lachnospiraceae bacterium]
MRESIITAGLAICSAVLIVLAAFGIFTADKTAPVISLEGKNILTYTEGESYDVLLEDVTAEDDKDGDVTDSLLVSNIYITSEDKAMVVYVAKDKSNNISKLKREVHYKKTEVADLTEEAQETAGMGPQDNTTATATQEGNLTAPKLTMIQNEATLKVGESFNLLRYIQGAVDVDGSSLNRYIRAEGTYDMSQPGVYSIRLYATSPAGVTSNIETFTLTVTP